MHSVSVTVHLGDSVTSVATTLVTTDGASHSHLPATFHADDDEIIALVTKLKERKQVEFRYPAQV
jgi:hypothetical protein